MGNGTKTDRLGDNDATSDDAGLTRNEASKETKSMEGPILDVVVGPAMKKGHTQFKTWGSCHTHIEHAVHL